MSRITELDKLLFPVKLVPIFAKPRINGIRQRINIPKNRLVMNAKDGTPLGVVGQNYRLVSNKEAIEIGRKCCIELFGLSEAKDIEVFKVDAPSTGSYCHIDLIHKHYSMNLWDEPGKPETYIPYIRITNSYNTTRRLRFDIGFCRKICLNGVIFEEETLDFEYSHSRGRIKDTIDFSIKKEQMDELASKFKAYTQKIKHFKLSKTDSYKILSVVYKIEPAEEIKDRSKMAEYEKLKRKFWAKLLKNRKEVGGNAYALFNTMTDIASNPPKNTLFRRDVNSMQRIAGNWINTFQARLTDDDFILKDYIQELENSKEKARNNRRN